MNGLPYYKAYPRDFLDGTIGMTLELKGAYRLVLDLIYMGGGALVDDARFIAGHLGCSVRAWNGYRKDLIMRGKISVENEIISNFRADKEMIITRSFQDKQRENASEPRKNKDLPLAVVKPKDSHTESETDKKETKGKNFGDFEAFWAVTPKKVGKYKAHAAYLKAVEKTDAGVLLDAMRAYAASRAGQDDQYTAHPATWLNAGRWNDAPPAPSKPKLPEHGDTRYKGEQRQTYRVTDGWVNEY